MEGHAEFTIDIDTGGTFTDGFVRLGQREESIKVLTTPHDLTVCFRNCLEEASKRFNVTLKEFLSRTSLARYSTTIATNTIIQKSGPKIGLLVTKGYEDILYSPERVPLSQRPELEPFIKREMVMGLEEEVDPLGRVKKPLKKEEILKAVDYLLESGARLIAVSLLNASLNSIHEHEVKEIIREEYPSYYLGSIPVFLSSDLVDEPEPSLRTHTILLNSYLHKEMVRYLYKAEEDMRKEGYSMPLLIVHCSGGVNRVAKTTALNSYNSGPAAGLIGSVSLSQLYGLDNVITLDIGGTSTDLGTIIGAKPNFDMTSYIEEIPIYLPSIQVKTFGAGGGSIARVMNGTIQVGPQSAGALPGPACFDRGGIEPTVTDADLILSYIDPDYFLGGRIKLKKEKAIKAIKEKIASPLGLETEEAALLMKKATDEKIAQAMARELALLGFGAEKAQAFTLMAYGGAGPTHCSSIAMTMNIPKIITSPFSGIFSSFGISTMDLLHLYTKPFKVVLQDGKRLFSDYEAFNQTVSNLQKVAVRDMKGEGCEIDHIIFTLEAMMSFEGGKIPLRVLLPRFFLETEEHVEHISKLFTELHRNLFPSEPINRKIMIETLLMRALMPITHFSPAASPSHGESPKDAYKGQREAFWPGEGRFLLTPIYERSLLKSGNKVSGPAIIEAQDTTYVIPHGKVFTVDSYLNGIIEEA